MKGNQKYIAKRERVREKKICEERKNERRRQKERGKGREVSLVFCYSVTRSKDVRKFSYNSE